MKIFIRSVLAGFLLCAHPMAVAQTITPRGSTDSDYLLLIYEDTECPACAQSHDLVTRVVDEIGVHAERVIYPVTTGRLESQMEGLISHCVFELFGNKQQSSIVSILHRQHIKEPIEYLKKMFDGADEFSASYQPMLDCISNEETKEKIKDGIRTGVKFGVQGTPSFQLLNWNTMQSVFVTGMPNNDQALREWIEVSMIQSTDPSAEQVDVSQFLFEYPRLNDAYVRYKDRSYVDRFNQNEPITDSSAKQIFRDALK